MPLNLLTSAARNTVFLAAGCGALVLAGAVSAAPDRLLRLDGRVENGAVTGIGSDGRVTIGGKPAVDMADLRGIRREGAVSAKPAPVELFLVGDSGALCATNLAYTDRKFDVFGAWGRNVVIPLAETLAVRMGRAPDGKTAPGGEPESFASARREGGGDRDTLFALSEEGLQVVRGALETMDAQQVGFVWNEKLRKMSRDKVYGLVLAGEKRSPDRTGQCRISMSDGSRFWARIEELKDGALRVRLPGGSPLSLPWSEVRSLDVNSPKMAFVSDLEPTHVVEEALVTFAGWSRDSNFFGKPMRIGDREFSKGIGMHSMCRLDYALEGAYETFAATIGMDAVAEGRGDCVFRVLGDDKELFSQRVRGADPAKDVSVPVTGVKRLSLILEWGEDLDIGDHGNWGDARLLKPGKR